MSTIRIASSVVGRSLAQPEKPLNLWLWGPPGVGKSSIVRAEAEKLGLPYIDFRGVTCEPTDVRGFPTVEGGVVRWARPEFLPAEGEGVLFLDELGQAPGLVQAALLQLTLDRCIGEHRLPDGWRIIAASNRQEDRAGVGRLNSALLDRFVHVDIEVSLEEWQEWALGGGIRGEVRSFLNFRPKLLSAFDATERTTPTPRSWATASRILEIYGDDEQLLNTTLAGAVGSGAAAEFSAFLRTWDRLPTLDEIRADPDAIPIPDDPGLLYAFAGLPAGHAGKTDKTTTEALCRLVLRLPVEFAIVALRDLLKLVPGRALKVPAVRDFLRSNRDLIAGPEEQVAA